MSTLRSYYNRIKGRVMPEAKHIMTHRINKLEEAIAELRSDVASGLKAIDTKLDALIRIEALQGQHAAAIERAFLRIEETERVLNGREGKPGIVGKTETTAAIVESHRWALRTIATVVIVQIVAAIAWLFSAKGG